MKLLFVKIFWSLALVADVLICCFTNIVNEPVDFWIPVILLPVLFCGLFLCLIVFLFIAGLFVNKKKSQETPNRFFKFMLERSCDLLLWFIGVKTVVIGEEIIPNDRRFYLVSNHISNIDPIATLVHLAKYNVAFVSKPENFKIPIAGSLIHKCGYLPIDRFSPRNSMKTLHKCVDLIKNDVTSVGIYPEGRRSFSGVLLEFKDGVFYVAKKAECPIVVMTVNYEKSKLRFFPFARTTAILKYITVIEPEEFEKMTTHELSDKVRQMMLDDGDKY